VLVWYGDSRALRERMLVCGFDAFVMGRGGGGALGGFRLSGGRAGD